MSLPAPGFPDKVTEALARHRADAHNQRLMRDARQVVARNGNYPSPNGSQVGIFDPIARTEARSTGLRPADPPNFIHQDYDNTPTDAAIITAQVVRR